VGTFTAGNLKVSVDGGLLRIDQEGSIVKLVEQVEHVTFSGKTAAMTGQPVLYVTERCVLQLTGEGMELVEIAPGIDLQQHVLSRMAFRPIVRGTPRLMDARIFRDGVMGLRKGFTSGGGDQA
jgi:propionate CoA-transferase